MNFNALTPEEQVSYIVADINASLMKGDFYDSQISSFVLGQPIVERRDLRVITLMVPRFRPLWNLEQPLIAELVKQGWIGVNLLHWKDNQDISDDTVELHEGGKVVKVQCTTRVQMEGFMTVTLFSRPLAQ